ncbi:nucleoid-associated protein [Desulfocurvibacter africanus]|uniref:nucleoid-associated protein n=1 Tax=Desulfocurvibacter africanus TaxID=873 RepID=UPI00047F6FBD|nr:nucleoid-associated protein [Desulfocurvibacter africanus]
MHFTNLKIERLIVHEVFERKTKDECIPPRYGNMLISLTPAAMQAIEDRIADAMGRSSQCVEMRINKIHDESLLGVCRRLLVATNGDFVPESARVADLLADAQKATNIPGGIIVVITGTVGNPGRKALIVIKAEAQDGFSRIKQSDGSINLHFLEELFLTPKARLYKIGAFVENGDQSSGDNLADSYKAFVFDHNMTSKDRDKAAVYFYDGFLGCAFLQSCARTTKEFYSYTSKFIDSLDVPEEQKVEYKTALYVYLKTDRAAKIQVDTFASSYLGEPRLQDAYRSHMMDKGFPMTAVAKDLSDIQSHLKQRRLRFRSNIRLTAPADSFKELVTVEVIDAPDGQESKSPQWTVLTIRDRIMREE